MDTFLYWTMVVFHLMGTAATIYQIDKPRPRITHKTATIAFLVTVLYLVALTYIYTH